MVNVADVVEEFPHSSVAVNTMVSLPVPPHELLNPLELFVQVTFPQSSLAEAPPLFDNHAVKSLVLPHADVKSFAGVSMLGA